MKMDKFFVKCLFVVIALFVVNVLTMSAWAEDDFSPMSLEQQVKVIKKEMVDLGKDITVLEDVLLYPMKSRVSVYLVADSGNLFSVEKLKLLLNGEIVKTYAYTERERNGFVKGAAQRIFIGNLKPGKHKLVAFVEGKGPRGRQYKRGATLTFEKKDDAQTFKLLIEDNSKRQKPNFIIKEYS